FDTGFDYVVQQPSDIRVLFIQQLTRFAWISDRTRSPLAVERQAFQSPQFSRQSKQQRRISTATIYQVDGILFNRRAAVDCLSGLN
ncbi:hypothetical protein SFRURICE_008605, partial [Spodoptera frugiperda]